jgi:hypothetical protein
MGKTRVLTAESYADTVGEARVGCAGALNCLLVHLRLAAFCLRDYGTIMFVATTNAESIL